LDIRDVLPVIQTPTLVLHRKGDHWTHADEARLLAENLPDSKLVTLPGEDHLPWYGNQSHVLNEIENYISGERRPVQNDRMLATLLLTDIVNSTKHLEAQGDENWASVLAQFSARTRRRVEGLEGVLYGDTGDGHVAAFAGPSRALECAQALLRDAVDLGFEIRAGVHTGECERHAEGLRGHAVHLTARLCDKAQAGGILATSTVRDLCIGSQFRFAAEGAFRLKGISDEVALFAVS
jgi:class 3 adenylate cyclase